MKHTTFSVDVAKSVFEVAVSDRPGHVRKTHRLTRARFTAFFATRTPATVVMEACGSAHHWGRELQTQGHRVVLLPPHAVCPYVPRNCSSPLRLSSRISSARRSAPSFNESTADRRVYWPS
jgi:transposase